MGIMVTGMSKSFQKRVVSLRGAIGWQQLLVDGGFRWDILDDHEVGSSHAVVSFIEDALRPTAYFLDLRVVAARHFDLVFARTEVVQDVASELVLRDFLRACALCPQVQRGGNFN